MSGRSSGAARRTPARIRVRRPLAPSVDNASRGASAKRTIAWTIGAAGLAQLGAAGYFGLLAFSKHAASNKDCLAGHCSQLGVERNDDSGRAADASTVLAITGFATVAAGLYLLLTSPKAPDVALPSRTPPRLAITGVGSTIVLQTHF